MDEPDPRGVIRESFRMEGIGVEECRAILFDWALGLPETMPTARAIPLLLARHQTEQGHPMLGLLREGLAAGPEPKRRGGRAGRQ